MTDSDICEYCLRPIKTNPVKKKLRSQEHVFCTEFCFRLYFYDVPRITFEDLNKMYALRCVTMKVPDFHTLIVENTES
jgi:hypothetical protein